MHLGVPHGNEVLKGLSKRMPSASSNPEGLQLKALKELSKKASNSQNVLLRCNLVKFFFLLGIWFPTARLKSDLCLKDLLRCIKRAPYQEIFYSRVKFLVIARGTYLLSPMFGVFHLYIDANNIWVNYWRVVCECCIMDLFSHKQIKKGLNICCFPLLVRMSIGS